MPYPLIPGLLLTTFLYFHSCKVWGSVAAQPPPIIGEAIQVSGPNDPGTVPGTNISYARPTGGSSEAVTEYTPASWWLAKVLINGQTFNLAVDTGSADLWVYGPRWTLAPGVGSLTTSRPAHTTYDCIRGATSNCSTIGTFNITYTYGFGASGKVISDTVNISNNIVSNMGVGVAAQAGQIALDAAPSPDGFLGLAFQALSRTDPPQPTFMERLMSKLPQPIFTVDFIPQPGGNNVAEIDFGYINPNKINGNLYTAPINNSTGFWLVENVTFVVGDLAKPGSLAVPESFSQSMIFDTGGSSLIDVNPIVAASYYSGVPGAYNITTPTQISWYFDCNATLPDLTLRIGNGTAVYPASQLKYQLGAGSCAGPIGSWATLKGGPGNLGAALFANYFVVFNQAVPEIQYAQSLAALEGAAAQRATTQPRRALAVDERKADVDENRAGDLMMLAENVV